MPKSFLCQAKFVISECELKEIKRLGISVNEAILLIYFMNQKNPMLNIPDMKKLLDMDEKTIMETFSSLMTKKIISLDVIKNEDKKLEEMVNLDAFYGGIEQKYQEREKEKKHDNIFNKFESEFGRTLSPMELEIINGWLNDNMSEELIIGALKEATFNAVSNLRYIDKILYEWRKKGYKALSDVKDNLVKRNDSDVKPKELFDYDWLNVNDK